MSAKITPKKATEQQNLDIQDILLLEKQTQQYYDVCHICQQLCKKAFAWYRSSSGTMSICSAECFEKLKKSNDKKDMEESISPTNTPGVSPILAAMSALNIKKK